MKIQPFFPSVSDIISDFQGQFIIMAGDFNLVHDVGLDYFNYVNINYKRAREKVLNIKIVHGLTDPRE